MFINAAFIQREGHFAFQALSTHTGVTVWPGSHTAGLGYRCCRAFVLAPVLLCILSGFIVLKVVLSSALGLQLQCLEGCAVLGGGSLLEWVALAAGQPDFEDLSVELPGRGHVQVAQASSDSQSKSAVRVLISAEVYSEHR